MAENQTDDKKKDDENDPYKFFKFAGPENNNDKDKKNKKGKKFPFWPILLITLLAVVMAEFFLFPKQDNLIDYSDFKAKIERGEGSTMGAKTQNVTIGDVQVKQGENTFVLEFHGKAPALDCYKFLPKN